MTEKLEKCRCGWNPYFLKIGTPNRTLTSAVCRRCSASTDWRPNEYEATDAWNHMQSRRKP